MDKLTEIKKALELHQSEGGRTQFLMEQTQLDSETVERLDRLGEPWDVGFHKYLPWLQEYKDLPNVDALTAIAPIITLDGEGRAASVGDITPEERQRLEQVANLSGQSFEAVINFRGACIKYVDHLITLFEAYGNDSSSNA